jgi:hypothetical protein
LFRKDTTRVVLGRFGAGRDAGFIGADSNIRIVNCNGLADHQQHLSSALDHGLAPGSSYGLSVAVLETKNVPLPKLWDRHFG